MAWGYKACIAYQNSVHRGNGCHLERGGLSLGLPHTSATMGKQTVKGQEAVHSSYPWRKLRKLSLSVAWFPISSPDCIHLAPRLFKGSTGCWHVWQGTFLRAKYSGTRSNIGLSCALPSSAPLQQPPPKLLLLSYVQLLLRSGCRAAPVCFVQCSNAPTGIKHLQALVHHSTEEWKEQHRGEQPARGTRGQMMEKDVVGIGMGRKLYKAWWSSLWKVEEKNSSKE